VIETVAWDPKAEESFVVTGAIFVVLSWQFWVSPIISRVVKSPEIIERPVWVSAKGLVMVGGKPG
jgi:hypothetical protein